MMIYTSDDGIVAWQSCRAEPGGTVAVAIEMRGAHLTICSNPVTLRRCLVVASAATRG